MSEVIEKPRIRGKLHLDRNVKEGLCPTPIEGFSAFYSNGTPVRFFGDTSHGQLVLFTDNQPDAMVAMAIAIGLERKINPAVNFADGYFFLCVDLPADIESVALAQGFECDRGSFIDFAALTFDCKGKTFSYAWLKAKTEKVARACLSSRAE